MTLRPLHLCLSASVLCGTLAAADAPAPAGAPVTPPAAAAAPEKMVENLQLSATDIDSALDLLEQLTGKTVLRPASLPSTTYTIQLKKPFPKSEAILALETILSMNGVSVVPLGDKFLKAVPLNQVGREAPEVINGSTLGLMPSGHIAAKLFQPDYLRIEDFVQQAGQLVSQGVGGTIVPFPKANAAMITDTVANLQRLETLLQRLDKPAPMPKFYTLKFAKASDLTQKIQSIIQNPVLAAQLGSTPSYTADDRTNQVILVADAAQTAFFDELINRLDVKADPNTRTEVMYLKHATSKDVASLLTQVISGQNNASQKTGGSSSLARVNGQQQGATATPGNAPAAVQTVPAQTMTASAILGTNITASTTFSSIVTVISDDRTNSVVVNGTQDDLRLIKELVDKIDIILAQVRIEVVILEVTLTDNDESGISALGLQLEGNKLVGVTGSTYGATLTGTGSTASSTTPDMATLSGGKLTGIVGLTSNTIRSRTTTLSNPDITTTHNKEGSIFVGSKIPTITSYLNDSTSSSTSSGYRTSITKEEVGITLKVTPLIGEDGSVQMSVEQEVSALGDKMTIDSNTQYATNTRKTKSFVTAHDGDILVLGGMQSKTHTRSKSRLGPIPIIGDLLGYKTNDISRTELIFFIRPHILTNNVAKDNVSAMERIEKMEDKQEVMKVVDPAAKIPDPKESKAVKPRQR